MMNLLGFRLEQSEVFSWIDPDTKELFTFDIERMRSCAEAGESGTEKVSFPIKPEMAELFLKDRAVDAEHVKRTSMELIDRMVDGPVDLSKEKSLQPLIGIALPDGKTLTVDGHHRLVMWTIMNLHYGLMWLFEYETAKQFILTMPDDVTYRIRAELST